MPSTTDVKLKFHVSFLNPDGSEEHFVRKDRDEVVYWPHRKQAMKDVNDALIAPERHGRVVALVRHDEQGIQCDEIFDD